MDVAFGNAERVIDIEQSLGLYFELALQDVFVDATAFIQFWNLYYGLFHFLVTGAVLVWAFARLDPARYRWWRRTVVFGTIVALVGYALFPLMPPRLLADCGEFGACQLDPAMAYVDTVTDIGGIWSFESDAVESVTNHYAAMPSLHIGWSLWVAALGIACFRSRRMKSIAVLHPIFTLFGVIVTGNHYWLDAIGGLIALLIGAGLGWVSGWVNAWVLSKLDIGMFRPANGQLSS